METILSWTGKDITEGKKRRISEIQVIFFFLSTQLFLWLKHEQIWYSLRSPDIDIADPVAASTFSLSPSIKRISHSQNPFSAGLGLCALRCTNVFWHKMVFWGIIFFFLYIHLLSMPPVLREVLHYNTLATNVAEGREHHWPKSINLFYLQIYCKTCEALNKYVH